MIRQEDLGQLRSFDDFVPSRPAPVVATRAAVPTRPSRAASMPIYAQAVPVAPAPAKRPRISHRQAIFASLAGLLIIAASGSLLALRHADANPIPANYQSSVDFPTYYPNASRLPAGFHFDPTSISKPANNILIYHINYGEGYQIYVSLQDKPSSDDLQTFNDQRIPLHMTVNTPAGQAVLGAIGNQTIASLPTNAKTWIIVAAPRDINQKQLVQVLESFKD